MKILFAIDGSSCSKQAIDTALTMKCPVGTEMKVASVVDFSEPFPAVEGAKEREIAAVKELVRETVEKLRLTHPEVEVDGVVLDGCTVDEILHLSYEWPAHLIMVGSHGRRGLSGFILGSVSRAILLNSRCAVRIVREISQEHMENRVMNVILALDESEHCKHLIDHVVALPWPYGTKFKCLHVVPELADEMFLDPDTGYANTLIKHYDEMMDKHKKWMEAEAQKLNKTFDQEVATAEVIVGDPREKILEIARHWPADLIMLGSHGRRGIEKLILGSVSEAVATHANCSVEVTRVPAFRKERMHVIV
jgi:nucleotide-binding universal stress UspA family protein